ncbi:fibroblast growth factor 4B-like isoform X1 [Pundamilia nyererei]|uniref:Fibroblast growth factor n=2 Tax=Percomorphaceae TaxID=1489872 RepID=A0A9Y6JB11_9CICH|nr:PREDICTED: fibroblast growth factor 4B-like isoform X1 [Pundamilia nyererei]XP_026032522.1 fibroblast growth factor 6 isoform X1 [Astatotilapia calliptera]
MAVAQRLLVSMSCEAGTPHWTLTAVVLLGFLLGIVSAYPLPSSRTNATLLEKRWETLFSRSVLGISGEKPELNWESDYLLGIKRVRRLYCNVGIGFHLQILPDGRINGVHNENQYSLIEISTVERGVVSLYGVKSELFVAMNSRGRLYGTVDSLPRRMQVQGELAREQLQRLRVSGLQRILHRTQQAWPREEGQQGHNCHDCNALPTPNMTSKKWQ